jgi:hypothetical protein
MRLELIKWLVILSALAASSQALGQESDADSALARKRDLEIPLNAAAKDATAKNAERVRALTQALEERLSAGSEMVTQLDACDQSCNYPALLVPFKPHPQDLYTKCIDDVILGNFEIKGAQRKGATFQMTVENPSTGAKSQKYVLMVEDKASKNKNSSSICIPDYVFKDEQKPALIFKEYDRNDNSRNSITKSMSRALSSPVKSYQSDLGLRSALRPFKTTGWLKVYFESNPDGADIIKSGMQTGYKTARILRVSPPMMSDISLKLNGKIIAAGDCSSSRPSDTDINLRIVCNFTPPSPKAPPYQEPSKPPANGPH